MGFQGNCALSSATGNQVGKSTSPIDPKLGALQANGGPTLTHALQFLSPAIDAGTCDDANGNSVISTDQRGVSRLQGPTCDIGAYEAEIDHRVTRFDDPNPGACAPTDCSLRDAIAAAGTGARIYIPSGTYALKPGTELTINSSQLTLTGGGQTTTVIQAATTSNMASSRVINISSGKSVAISKVAIRHGKITGGTGGGILNQGTLTLTDVSVNDNFASTGLGGGIGNTGALTTTNTRIWQNTANGGGGIYNDTGTVTISHSSVNNNDNVNNHGGGIYNNTGTTTISHSTVNNNDTRNNDGGGIYNNTGTVTISHSSVNNNNQGNNIGNSNGGGIYNNTGTVTITRSAINQNRASNANGGGIYNSGTLSLSYSTLTGNVATSILGDEDTGNGGSIWNSGTVNLTSSIINRNWAIVGGGIYNQGRGTVIPKTSAIGGPSASSQGKSGNASTTRIINSTISGNSATSTGGGIYNATSGAVVITHSTITGHSAPSGGGIHNLGALTISNTIVANSASGGDCINTGTTTDGGHNLVEDASCGFVNGVNGNITGLDPMLDELKDNDGPTLTHALLPGSPAIDAGNATACNDAELNNQDQRGYERQAGAGCDIGAFEFGAKGPTPVPGVTWPGLVALMALLFAAMLRMTRRRSAAG
jgi:hypothetical protein